MHTTYSPPLLPKQNLYQVIIMSSPAPFFHHDLQQKLCGFAAIYIEVNQKQHSSVQIAVHLLHFYSFYSLCIIGRSQHEVSCLACSRALGSDVFPLVNKEDFCGQ